MCLTWMSDCSDEEIEGDGAQALRILLLSLPSVSASFWYLACPELKLSDLWAETPGESLPPLHPPILPSLLLSQDLPSHTTRYAY